MQCGFMSPKAEQEMSFCNVLKSHIHKIKPWSYIVLPFPLQHHRPLRKFQATNHPLGILDLPEDLRWSLNSHRQTSPRKPTEYVYPCDCCGTSNYLGRQPPLSHSSCALSFCGPHKPGDNTDWSRVGVSFWRVNSLSAVIACLW